jgi:hypothetical protein
MLAQHLERLRVLEQQLVGVSPPSMFDAGDIAASEAAQAIALAVLHEARGIASKYVSTVPLGPFEDARPLPSGFGEVALLADALVRRASWLHHAWTCNGHGMPNTWREPSTLELGDARSRMGPS